jgi:hypothetical protein
VRTIHKEGAARLARTDIIAGGRLGLSGVLADCSTELPGHGLVKIAGDNTGLPGSRALSAGGSTGLYGWDAGGSTGLPVSRLLKKADAGGNFGFPGRTDDNSGRQGHRLGGSARLPKDVDVNYSQYTQVSRGSLGVNGVRKGVRARLPQIIQTTEAVARLPQNSMDDWYIPGQALTVTGEKTPRYLNQETTRKL